MIIVNSNRCQHHLLPSISTWLPCRFFLSFFSLPNHDDSNHCWLPIPSSPPILTSPWLIAVRPYPSPTGLPLLTASVVRWTEWLPSTSHLWICTTPFPLLPSSCYFFFLVEVQDKRSCSQPCRRAKDLGLLRLDRRYKPSANLPHNWKDQARGGTTNWQEKGKGGRADP